MDEAVTAENAAPVVIADPAQDQNNAAVNPVVNLWRDRLGQNKSAELHDGFYERARTDLTCEDTAELQLQQRHVVSLETRPPNSEGKGEVTMRDLVKNASAA